MIYNLTITYLNGCNAILSTLVANLYANNVGKKLNEEASVIKASLSEIISELIFV